MVSEDRSQKTGEMSPSILDPCLLISDPCLLIPDSCLLTPANRHSAGTISLDNVMTGPSSGAQNSLYMSWMTSIASLLDTE